jgi:hypothetical protein
MVTVMTEHLAIDAVTEILDGLDENKMFVAAGPVSRIRRAALQVNNVFEISRRRVSMMSTLAVMAGFASHRRHRWERTPRRPYLFV